jgi:hypothetical protein
MTTTKRNPVIGHLALGSVLFVFACGGGSGNTFGDGTNGAGTGTGTTGTGDLGLTGGGTGATGGGTGTGTQIPGGVPGQTISPDSACVADKRQGEQVPIDLYFMVDKTGSMTCPTGRAGDRCSSPPNPPVVGPTRWSEMSKALNAFIILPENAGLGAGIGFFPRPGNDTTNDPRITCQEPDYEKPDVDIGVLPDVAGAIATSIMSQMPGGSTPTVPSITAALKYAAQHQAATPSRRTALVYATDGIPQGCTNNTVAAAARVAANALAMSSIPTYVLGVGPQLTSLNDIAAAGGTGMAYLVDTGGDVTAQLAAALHAIKSMAVTCDYTIPMSSAGPIDPTQVNVIAHVGDAGTPTLIGQVNDKASCDAAGGGWYYNDPAKPTVITLCTTTCNPLLMTPNSGLQVLIGCATQGQPVK